jgi:hypothetical protein
MKQFLIVSICIATVLTAAAAEDPLSAAREQYASAAYEEALVTLGQVSQQDTTPAILEQADQYRAFSLFALGRTADAQVVAENLIRKNPTLVMDATDASPRIAAMFASVRRRLLPSLVREHYRDARALIQSENLAGAEPRLLEVRQMLDEAAKIDAMDEGMSDLRVLVDGFLDLAHSVGAKPAAAPRVSPALSADASAPAAVPGPAKNGASAAPFAFDGADARAVTAPVAIRQDVPAVPQALMRMFQFGQTTGQIEVLIDESGNVEQSAMRQSLQPGYDAIVLRAAKLWKYEPAKNGEVPVKYLKTISVVVQK